MATASSSRRSSRSPALNQASTVRQKCAPSSSETCETCNARPSRTTSSTARRSATSTLATLSTCLVLALAALLVTPAQAAPFEPPGNQVLFGAWIDVSAGYSDSPRWINQRVQRNIPVFQIAQAIPLPPYNYTTGAGGAAPESSIEESGTDAAVFLTVYPTNGFGAVAVSDFEALAEQISAYQTLYNRTVFLRYAPEMQGLWFPYGNQPVEFNTSWHQMASVMRQRAPQTILVWAPNTPQGYPYGQTLTQGGNTPADQAALDTSGDGALTAADDPFSPYYPGDDVVDWIGLSIYYKGPSNSDSTNEVQPDGYCANVINGWDPQRNSAMVNWYQNYCAAKPDKACMFAESGAAYHVDDTGSASQAQLQQAWLDDCITNATLYEQFPRLKLVMAFEHEKYEESNTGPRAGQQDLRDFRITNATEPLAEFVAEIGSGAMATIFSWAQPRAVPTYISSPGAPAFTPSTVIQAITATTRGRPTGFPALFGNTYTSAAHQLIEMAELGVLVTSGLAGVLAVMRYL